MRDQTEVSSGVGVHEVSSQNGPTSHGNTADAGRSLRSTQTGIDADGCLGETELCAAGPDAVIASQSKFQSTAQSQTCGQGNRRFAGSLEHVEQFMTLGSEIVDVGDGVGSNFVDEEFHVSSGNKGLTGTVDHDGVDRIVGVGGCNRFSQLTDHGYIQRIHGFRAIDGDGRDAVLHGGVNIGKVPGRVALLGEERRNIPALSRCLGIGCSHAASFPNADSVHHLKRSTRPSKTDFGPAVNVFHAADVLFNDLSGDAEHHAEQALGNGGVLLVGVSGLLGYIPLFVGINQRTKVGSSGVARGVKLLCEVIGGMQGDRWPGQVHQTKGTQTDAEGFAGDGVDLCSIGSALFEQETGFVEPRHEKAIHDESRSVGADDDDFSEHFAVLNDLVDRFLA